MSSRCEIDLMPRFGAWSRILHGILSNRHVYLCVLQNWINGWRAWSLIVLSLRYSSQFGDIEDNERTVTALYQAGLCKVTHLAGYRFAMGAHEAGNFSVCWRR